MVNIVSFNGGRGAKNLIPALLNKDGINLTSIVNAYDDGKSTGELRNFFKMLGPSDIRKVQEAMVPTDLPDYEGILKLYDFRYPVGLDRDEIINRLYEFADGKTDKPTMVIPIKLREQIIGVIHVKAPSEERQWTSSEINLTETVSERLSLALENARLIQESQRQAIK